MKKLFVMLIGMLMSLSCMAMDDLLVYYGYLSSFNSAQNAWSNDAVVADIGSKYKVVVFGDTVQSPSHTDYNNSKYIIAELKSNYPTIKIFGYVTTNQSLQDFQSKASQWDTLEVDGIFFDEYGYDYSPTRQDQNARITFVRQLNFATLCFVNAWNIDHALGTVDDVSYPNATYNSTLDESLLGANDYYMLESYVMVNGAYADLPTFLSRANKAKLKAVTYPIKLAGLGVIDDNDAVGQTKFDDLYIGAHVFGLDLIGSSHLLYGASAPQIKFWVRPDLSHL